MRRDEIKIGAEIKKFPIWTYPCKGLFRGDSIPMSTPEGGHEGISLCHPKGAKRLKNL